MLKVEHLKKYFPVQSGFFGRKSGNIYVIDDVSFSIAEGETLGLVGESGCGKSTLARTILRFYKPTSGTISFEGQDLWKLSADEMRLTRRNMQIIFQDPVSSLNPRMTIESILSEPFLIHKVIPKSEIPEALHRLLDKVGLKPNALDLFPHEFSGGQRQRICIARALALNPKFIVCDEPVSALDVSIRSQILNLLVDLRKEFKLSYLFISHDLAVVKHMSDRVAVMYLGKIVELASNQELFSKAAHPYTKALIEAIPRSDFAKQNGLIRATKLISGDVPSPFNPPKGCHFHPRCPLATDKCKVDAPSLRNIGSENNPHWVSCHYA